MTRQLLPMMGVMCSGLAFSGAPCAGQTHALLLPPPAFEGYGAATSGGAGGDVYTVTSLADDGPGTLRDGITRRSGPRVIVFGVGGTVTLQSDLLIRQPYLTIDGSTAPPPGITIRPANATTGATCIGGTHDIILTHLRFHGLWERGGAHANVSTLGIDGDSGPDRHARRIVLDHLTIRNSIDGGPDLWGHVSDVTVSWCLCFYSWHPTSVSHYPSPFQIRERISLHHNVYAKNGERNPQLRADVRSFDMVNNVIYDWGFFGENSGGGTRVRNDPGEPRVHANLVNNYFLATTRPQHALIYGTDPGPDASEGRSGSGTPAQGALLTSTAMGQLYVAGNVLPPENRDHYSTVAAPLPVPPAAAVWTLPADQLKAGVLPWVGLKFRAPEEQQLLDELASRMTGVAGPLMKADFNGDARVDGADISHLLACTSGAGRAQPSAACRSADLDGDGDVDQSDFGVLQCCLTSGVAVLDEHCYLTAGGASR